MHVDTDEPRCTSDMFLFAIRNMKARGGVNVVFSQTEVYGVDDRLFVPCSTNNEVLWFDVAKEHALAVDILHPSDLNQPR